MVTLLAVDDRSDTGMLLGQFGIVANHLYDLSFGSAAWRTTLSRHLASFRHEYDRSICSLNAGQPGDFAGRRRGNASHGLQDDPLVAQLKHLRNFIVLKSEGCFLQAGIAVVAANGRNQTANTGARFIFTFRLLPTGQTCSGFATAPAGEGNPPRLIG